VRKDFYLPEEVIKLKEKIVVVGKPPILSLSENRCKEKMVFAG
jgi:hypothetical protein